MYYYVFKLFTLSEINPELEQLEANNKYIMKTVYRVKAKKKKKKSYPCNRP
jgi:hypothetical protein